MEQMTTLPSIMIDPWPTLAVPVNEIKNILSYLAYKTNKQVTLRQYSDDEGYSQNSISVRVAVTDGGRNTGKTGYVKLGGKVYELTENQVTVDIGKDVPEKNRITDDNFLTLAFVDHNRIIIPFELTATDNETSRVLLSYIIEQSIELLDFKINSKLLQQRRKLAKHFCQTFARNVQSRILERKKELMYNDRESEKAYYQILDCERKKPILQQELEYLQKLVRIDNSRLFRTQAQALIELQSSGEYTSITTDNDGSLTATTAPITIDYDDYRFPLGRYTVHIDMAGEIRIKALDPHPNADYPHPHINSNGIPCIGNFTADISKMLGTMRIAEALQTLYAFLCEYNPNSPYEKIGHFDPTEDYKDEDEDPCNNCDERCSGGYCIFECSNNNGQYKCEDCNDRQTDYCYLECSYNEDFSRFSPCSNCEREREQCNAECPFFEKSQELKELAKNANTG